MKQILSLSLGLLGALQLSTSNAVELEAISITASRTPVSLNATGSAITVITEQDIRDSQQQFVADVLRDVPGVAINKSGSFGNITEVRMRGSEANHVLVIIDGIEMNPGSGNSVNLAHLLTADIERIEVLRGAQSTLWGSDAIGGVVAITTRRGKEGKRKLHLEVEEGSFNTSQHSVSTSGATEKTRYGLSLSRINTDGFSSADNDTFTYILPDGSSVTQGGTGEENDGYVNRTISGSISHEFTNALTIDAAVRQVKYQSDSDDFGVGPIDSTIDSIDSDESYMQAGLRYSHLNDRMQHQWKIADADLDRISESSFGTSSSRNQKRQYSYQLDFYFRQPGHRNDSHGLTLAIEREQNSNDSSFTGFRKNETDSAVLEYRFDYGEKLSSAVAYRHDKNSVFKDADIGHASLSYQINPSLRLHSSVGNGIKNPTLFELYGFSPTFVGNGDLKPEKSESVDAGLAWHIDKARLFDITLYYLRLKDQITGAGNQSINIEGEGKANGVELAYKGEFDKHWSFGGSLTLQASEDASGNNLVRRPDTLANINVAYAYANAQFNVDVNYHGTQDDFYFAGAPSYNTSQVRVAAYTLVNLSVRYQYSEQVQLMIRAENYFNRKYQESIGYGTADRGVYAGLRVEM